MISGDDYSVLDRPEVHGLVFYPRKDWTETPPGASDYVVPVEEGVSISCRFYFAGLGGPSILFFHGNGEVASDYDAVAPMYRRLGLNLFVADYRGYGLSGGRPSVSHLMSDCHAIFRYFQRMLRTGGYQGGLLVMGRSLGSYPAVELAFHHQDAIDGVIIESGFASVGRLFSNLGLPLQLPGLVGLDKAHLDKIRSIRVPALVLHGEQDFLVPFREGKALFDALGSPHKNLVSIPGAGHNDIMTVGNEQYFSAIGEFAEREI